VRHGALGQIAAVGDNFSDVVILRRAVAVYFHFSTRRINFLRSVNMAGYLKRVNQSSQIAL